MDKIVSLSKRRGFVFPGSEIYGGLANTWTYGPLGAQMMRNIRNHWWQSFVVSKPEIYGLDSEIIMSPKVWEASGHTSGFSDAMIECKKCHRRTRADHLIENNLKDVKVEGLPTEKLDEIIAENKLPCPYCGAFDWTPARNFNLLFETHIGIVPETESLAYLRGETAQGMFVNFLQVVQSMRPKLPFGIAQIGKAFRNEITKGNFIFRTLEFEQMEIEYFIRQDNWEKHFDEWKELMWNWITDLGVSPAKLRWREHTKDELAFYSIKTEDIEYDFPFGGFKELYGLAYRTDYDLKNHAEKSGVDLRYLDPTTNEKFFPHVIEPTFGLNRTFLTLLIDAYIEDSGRVYLKLDKRIAPYRLAVFPLVRNKEQITNKAKEVFDLVKDKYPTAWDDRGNIGKRYFSQDEIGTPYCVTVDYQTLEDNTVTIRDRDTMQQERIKIDDILKHIA